MNKFKSRNKIINVQYVLEEICPSDRSNSFEQAKFKAYVFSFLLGNMYTNKTVHNYKSVGVRDNIVSLLNISQRSYYRLLKSAFEHGYLILDRDNPNHLRIVGNGKLVDAANAHRKKDGVIKHWYKVELNLRNLDFNTAMNYVNAALSRFIMYKEKLKSGSSRKKHMTKAQTSSSSNSDFDLNYYNCRPINEFASTHSTVFSLIRNYLNGFSPDLGKAVYNKENCSIGISKTVDGTKLRDFKIFNSKVNTIKNSVVSDYYNYFYVTNISYMYDEDLSSKLLGRHLGYTKSGMNSSLDRMEDAQLITRHNRFVFIDSCTYNEYSALKRHLHQVSYDCENELLKSFIDRIIYRHGCVLMQRENLIVYNNSLINFKWDYSSSIRYVGENNPPHVPKRYSTLCAKLGYSEKSLGNNPRASKKLVMLNTGETISNVYKLPRNNYNFDYLNSRLNSSKGLVLGKNVFMYLDKYNEKKELINC